MLVKSASRCLNSQFIKAPQSGADYQLRNRSGQNALVNQFTPAIPNGLRSTTKAQPNRALNRALNRTLHSLPVFGLQNPSPNTVNLFRAG